MGGWGKMDELSQTNWEQLILKNDSAYNIGSGDTWPRGKWPGINTR